MTLIWVLTHTTWSGLKKNEYWMKEMNYMYLLHIRQFKETQAESSAMYLSETKDVEQQN